MNELTWIHVASDAVKIGLGALIGTGASLLITHQKQRHTENLEYSQRRRDLLEKVMPKFDDASLDAMSQVVKFLDAVTSEYGVEAEIDKDTFSFEERTPKIFECNAELNLVESNVSLLGYKDLANEVEEFRARFRTLVELERAERVQAMQEFQKLSDLRYSIIDGFSEAYRDA